MKREFWVWTELLAFDRDLPEHGAAAYLKTMGTTPTGILLLLSAIDFVLLHRGMKEEYELFPDVCSRSGHACNEERARQKWSNYDLRELIAALRRRGIKVFFSFFIANMHDKWHHEFVTDHPEIRLGCRRWGIDNAISMLARLDDGRLLDEILADKIAETVADYGFDGWCGPDGQGPGWSLLHSDSSDNFARQFSEYLGEGRIPAQYLEPAGDSEEKMSARVNYFWQNLRREWADFTSQRWIAMWSRITAKLHQTGRETMIYSPFAQSVFESIFFFGLDTRALRSVGIDYLVTESVTTSCSLLYGDEERLFDNSAIINELRVTLPECKLIVMVGVKDVVESFDPLRHAPMRLERDIYAHLSQCHIAGGRARRSAEGFMVCLGDGLTPAEWSAVTELHRRAFECEPAACGDAAWLLDGRVFDRLRDEYPKHGDWPPYRFAGELARTQGIDFSCICTPAELDGFHGPLLVPHFHLLEADLRRQLLRRRECTILFGDLAAAELPPESPRISCRVGNGCRLDCAVLNGRAAAPPTDTEFDAANGPFEFSDWNRYIRYRCPQMHIPAEFWDAVGAMLRAALPEPLVSELAPGIRTLTIAESSGKIRLALMSTADTYTTTRCRFADRVTALRKISPFPYMPLELRDHELSSPDFRPTVNLPPHGMILLELETDHNEEHKTC